RHGLQPAAQRSHNDVVRARAFTRCPEEVGVDAQELDEGQERSRWRREAGRHWRLASPGAYFARLHRQQPSEVGDGKVALKQSRAQRRERAEATALGEVVLWFFGVAV